MSSTRFAGSSTGREGVGRPGGHSQESRPDGARPQQSTGSADRASSQSLADAKEQLGPTEKTRARDNILGDTRTSRETSDDAGGSEADSPQNEGQRDTDPSAVPASAPEKPEQRDRAPSSSRRQEKTDTPKQRAERDAARRKASQSALLERVGADVVTLSPDQAERLARAVDLAQRASAAGIGDRKALPPDAHIDWSLERTTKGRVESATFHAWGTDFSIEFSTRQDLLTGATTWTMKYADSLGTHTSSRDEAARVIQREPTPNQADQLARHLTALADWNNIAEGKREAAIPKIEQELRRELGLHAKVWSEARDDYLHAGKPKDSGRVYVFRAEVPVEREVTTAMGGGMFHHWTMTTMEKVTLGGLNVKTGEVLSAERAKGANIQPGLGHEDPVSAALDIVSGRAIVKGVGKAVLKGVAKSLGSEFGERAGAKLASKLVGSTSRESVGAREVESLLTKTGRTADSELIGKMGRERLELGSSKLDDAYGLRGAAGQADRAVAEGERKLDDAAGSGASLVDEGSRLSSDAQRSLKSALENQAPAVSAAELGRIGTAGSRESFRAELTRRLAAEPDHPLQFLLSDAGKLRPSTTRGLTQDVLFDTPEIIEAGHIVSARALTGAAAGTDRFVVMSAWRNRVISGTIEHATKGGSIRLGHAVEIGGIPVDASSAADWVAKGLLSPSHLATARKVAF